MKWVYTGIFDKPPVVEAMHVGLETGVVKAKHPGMDMISVGPTIQNVHTPDESLEVASVPKVYHMLATALGQIK